MHRFPFRDEEAVDGLDVVVVLVLGRLHRLGLDQQLAREADLVLVLDDEMQEPSELRLLAREIRVEERVVALTAAPQHVVLAAQALRDLQHVLDLGSGIGEHRWIRVGGCAGLVAGVAEQVCRAPQETHTGSFLVARRLVDERVEVVAKRGERIAFGGHVTVVEAVVGDADLLEELEGGGHLDAGRLHAVVGVDEPRAIERAEAEHVNTTPRKRVPEAHARAKVIDHALAHDHALGLVDLERQGIGRVEAAEPDWLRHPIEELVAHCISSSVRFSFSNVSSVVSDREPPGSSRASAPGSPLIRRRRPCGAWLCGSTATASSSCGLAATT
jgi:hypothetical protein